MDKTALSYWYPKLKAACVPVPRTKIMHMPEAAQREVWEIFDGKNPETPHLEAFAEAIAGEAGSRYGAPFFLRTGHTSGKHNWSRTCLVPNCGTKTVARHIVAIAEFSEICGFPGLPWEEWVVRPLLRPAWTFGTCPAYEGMPVTKEFRFFVVDDRVVCAHPYWPREALVQGGAHLSAEAYENLCDMGPDRDRLYYLASRAGEAVGGAWSVDIYEARGQGWLVTDMAEAEKSWHWPGCGAI